MSWAPNPAVVQDAMAHAEAEAPNESCGLVIKGEYVAMQNVHHDPQRAFEMVTRDVFAHLQDGNVEAIVHSHVGLPPTPSMADRTSIETTKKPWLIVSVPARTYLIVEPSGFRAPLVGRQFSWGLHDCYALIRDGLYDYADIVLEDVERQWEFWLSEGNDVVRQLYPRLGFVEMPQGTPLKHCDLLVMRLRGKVPNHMGLFIAPDKLLHQMSGRLSTMEVYGGTWQQLTEIHLRHRLLIEHEAATPAPVAPAPVSFPAVMFSRGRNL